MSDRPTDALLRELSEDLEPVQPIPRLRTVALLAVALSLVLAGINTLMTGWPFPFSAAGLPFGELSFVATLSGLGLAAAGALAAALAGAVPGRDVAARAGRVMAALGVALAVVGAICWALWAGRMEPAIPVDSCIGCASHAFMLALPPALVVGVFLGRALARRPLVLAAFAALGAVSLGAGLIHAACTDGGSLHVAVGHVGGPLALTLLLVGPLAWLARRGSGPRDRRA